MRTTLLAWAAGILLASGAEAGPSGYIQVRGHGGVEVLIDGQSRGQTADDDVGLVVKDLVAGAHRMQALYQGFQAEECTLVVQDGRVTLYELQPIPPPVQTRQFNPPQPPPQQPGGALWLHSVPVDCQLSIPSLQLDGIEKKQTWWIAERVPVGQYPITARALGKTLSVQASVAAGAEARYVFDFVAGEVRNVSPLVNSLGMRFVNLPAGQYLTRRDNRSETPAALIVAAGRPFAMADREVTRGQWRQLMGELPRRALAEDLADELPMLVTWEEAIQFTLRLCSAEGLPPGSYRLPNEEEWEYACRAGTAGDFSGSLDDLAWYRQTSRTGSVHALYDSVEFYRLRPVGLKSPNPWGLYDLHGNAAEWCLDAVPAAPGPDGVLLPLACLAPAPPTLPAPAPVNARIVRGGNYRSEPGACASWYRQAALPAEPAAGIRLIRLLP